MSIVFTVGHAELVVLDFTYHTSEMLRLRSANDVLNSCSGVNLSSQSLLV